MRQARSLPPPTQQEIEAAYAKEIAYAGMESDSGELLDILQYEGESWK